MSLSNCFSKAGKNISATDRIEIERYSRQLRKRGLSEKDADKRAVSDYVQKLRVELAGLHRQVEEQGGIIPEKLQMSLGKKLLRKKSDVFTVTPDSFSDKFIRKVQNKFNRINKIQDSIKDTFGQKAIDEDANVVLAEEAFYGKAEWDLKQMEKTYVEPLMKSMSENGIKPEELSDFLYAMHAKERNDYIASINGSMQDGGSGMTTKDANEFLNKKLKSGRYEKLLDSANYVYSMLDKAKSLKQDAGILNEQDVEALEEGSFKYYVPLKGFTNESDAPADYSIRKNSQGTGFSVVGTGTKKALGRKSKAASPLFQAIQDSADATIRARKNEVGQSFLKLARQFPNKDYWEIYSDDNPAQSRTKKEGEVVEGSMSSYQMSSQFFPVREKGKQYYIQIKDPEALAAMKNMGPETLGSFLKFMGVGTRILSSLMTSLNPEFVFTNFMRDVQTAVISLVTESSIENGRAKGMNTKKLAKTIVKDTFKAIAAISTNLRNKPGGKKLGPWVKLYDQFQEDGAKTGYFDMKEVDQLAESMNSEMAKLNGGVKGNLLKVGSSFMNFIERMNEAIENGVRLSTYKHALDSGLTRQEAATLAKNLTVNFNRKGTMGASVNAMYAFANASVQGTAVVARLAIPDKDVETGKRKFNFTQKSILLGLPMLGFLTSWMARKLAGEDETGEDIFDKEIKDYQKQRSIIVPKSLFGGDPKDYYQIPMPYGYSFFQNIGVAIESMMNGHKKEKGALWGSQFIASSLVNNYVPFGIDFSDDYSKALITSATPTVLKPISELAVNRNFMGNPIYNDISMPGDVTPKSEKGKKHTSEVAKYAAKILNSVSGGDEHESGFLDTYPETLEHIVKQYTGGVGKLAVNTEITTEAAVKGELDELPSNKVPFYRVFNGEILGFANKSKFYDRKKELSSHLDRFKALDRNKRFEYRQKHGQHVRLAALADEIEKHLRRLRKQAKQVDKANGLSDEKKKAAQEKISNSMQELFNKFNSEYNEVFN